MLSKTIIEFKSIYPEVKLLKTWKTHPYGEYTEFYNYRKQPGLPSALLWGQLKSN
jgi:hypothetical protein